MIIYSLLTSRWSYYFNSPKAYPKFACPPCNSLSVRTGSKKSFYGCCQKFDEELSLTAGVCVLSLPPPPSLSLSGREINLVHNCGSLPQYSLGVSFRCGPGLSFQNALHTLKIYYTHTQTGWENVL